MGDWLRDRLPAHVDVADMLEHGRFVDEDGRAVRADDPYGPHRFVWFHRDLREEPEVTAPIHVVHRDERLVVVDKPPFLSSIPRGRHVQQSVVVRLRAQLGLPDLSPLHRLDRVTSGLLMLATEPRWRGPYQTLFERRGVHKTYWARGAGARGPRAPRRGPQPPAQGARLVAGRGGARRAGQRGDARRARVPEADGRGVYRLTPRTGRTHQLRVHLHGLGIPIVDDPLYPEVLDVEVDDFSRPLQLLAGELAFTDPVDGSDRRFRSVRRLPLLAGR